MKPMPSAAASQVNELAANSRSQCCSTSTQVRSSKPDSVAITRSRPARPRSAAPMSAGITRYGVTVAWSGKVSTTRTATAPPSTMATVDSRNRWVIETAWAIPAHSTTNSAPSRYRWPATAASEVRAATVNTRAARATRPTSVTLRVCPRSCP